MINQDEKLQFPLPHKIRGYNSCADRPSWPSTDHDHDLDVATGLHSNRNMDTEGRTHERDIYMEEIYKWRSNQTKKRAHGGDSHTERHIHGDGTPGRDMYTEEMCTWRVIHMEGHTHGGRYTRGEIHTGGDTHGGTYTRRDIHTEGHTHGGTYTRRDKHTEGFTRREHTSGGNAHAGIFTLRIYMEDHTYGRTGTEVTYTLNKLCTLDVLNRLLNGICTRSAGPVCSTRNLVNRNGAHLLDNI